jgi:uncharacterized membrane protein
MKASSAIQLVNLWQAERTQENAEKFVTLLAEEADEITDIKKHYLTKEDFYKEMATVQTKIDASAKWTVGFVAVMLSLAVAIIKLT